MNWLWNNKPRMPKQYDEPENPKATALQRGQIQNTSARGKARAYGDIYLEPESEMKSRGAAAIRGLQEAGQQMKRR